LIFAHRQVLAIRHDPDNLDTRAFLSVAKPNFLSYCRSIAKESPSQSVIENDDIGCPSPVSCFKRAPRNDGNAHRFEVRRAHAIAVVVNLYGGRLRLNSGADPHEIIERYDFGKRSRPGRRLQFRAIETRTERSDL
jgi:hypothetical protein